MSDTITLEVLRYHPETDSKPHFQRYTVPYREDWVVLDALNYLKDQVDGSISYRWSCRMGVCGSCGMMVNGTPKLTCAATKSASAATIVFSLGRHCRPSLCSYSTPPSFMDTAFRLLLNLRSPCN